jgi:hypothetical protein
LSYRTRRWYEHPYSYAGSSPSNVQPINLLSRPIPLLGYSTGGISDPQLTSIPRLATFELTFDTPAFDRSLLRLCVSHLQKGVVHHARISPLEKLWIDRPRINARAPEPVLVPPSHCERFRPDRFSALANNRGWVAIAHADRRSRSIDRLDAQKSGLAQQAINAASSGKGSP